MLYFLFHLFIYSLILSEPDNSVIKLHHWIYVDDISQNRNYVTLGCNLLQKFLERVKYYIIFHCADTFQS